LVVNPALNGTRVTSSPLITIVIPISLTISLRVTLFFKRTSPGNA
jgi:hypothetical protein